MYPPNKGLNFQELQNDLDRETSNLQELEAQKQDAQDRLEEMEQQKAKLKDMLSDVRQKCHEEAQVVSEGEGAMGEPLGLGAAVQGLPRGEEPAAELELLSLPTEPPSRGLPTVAQRFFGILGKKTRFPSSLGGRGWGLDLGPFAQPPASLSPRHLKRVPPPPPGFGGPLGLCSFIL